MKPTDAQRQAIELKGKSLLVSAGAGSGKTTVLTQRIMKKILEGSSITDFLIVTFTKAATGDIRKKLAGELAKLSAQHPDNSHIYRQFFLLPEADICTISSYCLRIVRENHSMLGISPGARMIDEVEESMLKAKVLDAVISDCFEENSDWFIELVHNFSDSRGVGPLCEAMLKLYADLRVIDNRDELLLGCADSLELDAEAIAVNGIFASKPGIEAKSRLCKYFDELKLASLELLEYVAAIAVDSKNIAPAQTLYDGICTLCDSMTSYSHMKSVYAGLKFINAYNKGLEPDAAEYIKKEKSRITSELKNVMLRYCSQNEEQIVRSFVKTASLVRSICRFLNLFDSAYTARKCELGVLDFDDPELLALKILRNSDGTRSELCLQKMAGISEVFIDEYQDVNPIQDTIFSLLSRENGRFMVGDIKQSIYRFRNAYPDIFLSYKEKFGEPNDEDSPNAKIFLRENFRCSDCIVKFVNNVFERITQDTPYRIEYDSEWLVHASVAPELNHPVVVAVAEKQSIAAEDSEVARKLEAEYIASEIRRLVDNECSDDGTDYEYSDFAIMLSAIKDKTEAIENALQKFGIPYKTAQKKNFFANPDIMLAIAAMKAVDNPTDDIALCALMRSPIGRFTSDELLRIRSYSRGAGLYSALYRYARPRRPLRQGPPNCFRREKTNKRGLHTKCRDFTAQLDLWRSESIGMSCDEFLKSFFVSSGLMRICISTGNRNSLLMLYDYARRYEKSELRGLGGFVEYLGELESGKDTLADAITVSNENAVSLITVHKSKGLEYKVCFVARADRSIKGAKADIITFTRGRGIFFKLRDRKRHTVTDTLCNVLACDAEMDATRGEELRKLYVALTRAKERLYITGVANAECFEREMSFGSSSDWLSWILSACNSDGVPFYERVLIGECDADGSRAFFRRSKTSIVPTEEAVRNAEYVYPYSDEISMPKKISVSELREGLLEDDEYNRTVSVSVPRSRVSFKPVFASEYITSAADIGTANHLFMQFCSFEYIEKHGIEAEAKRLLGISMIDEKQYGMLDMASLKRFFESSLYSDIKNSKRVYREKRFSVKDITDFPCDRNLLVQGVIDCFFENPDGSYTVVDYKTDRIEDPDELIRRHRVQLTAYARTVESMTGRPVSRAVLYSFALGREVALI